MSNEQANPTAPVEAAVPTRLRRPWFAYGVFLVLAPLCVGNMFQNVRQLFWHDASDTLPPVLEALFGLCMLAGGVALLYSGIDRFVVNRGMPVKPKSRAWRATLWMFLLTVGVNLLTLTTVAVGSARRAADKAPEQSAPVTDAVSAGEDSLSQQGGSATAGDWSPLGEKPFGLWRPYGWNRGDEKFLNCDAVIQEPKDRAVVSAAATLLVDLPKPMRDPAQVVANWRDVLEAESIDQESLPVIPCVLLGQQTHLHQIDATIKSDQGPQQLRYGKAAVLHGKYLCEVTLIGQPSFLENLGVTGVQEIVSWYVPKAAK